MKIRQDCIIRLIEENGFICDYQDSFSEGSVTYHFKPYFITFQNSCVSIELATLMLDDFGLSDRVDEIQNDKCFC